MDLGLDEEAHRLGAKRAVEGDGGPGVGGRHSSVEGAQLVVPVQQLVAVMAGGGGRSAWAEQL